MEQALSVNAGHALTRARLRLDVFERTKLLDADSLLAPYEQKLDELTDDMFCTAEERIQNATLYLEKLEHQLQLRHPSHLNKERAQLLTGLEARLKHVTEARMADFTARIAILNERLQARSPQQTLRRGYALVTSGKKLIRRAADVPPGAPLAIRVADGIIKGKSE